MPALPDPATFAFRAELVREPRSVLPGETLSALREALEQRTDVASAWLTRERRTRVADGVETLGQTLAVILVAPPDRPPDPPGAYDDRFAVVVRALGSGGSGVGVSVPTRRALRAVRGFGVCVFEREPE